jgi:hypothetical protein
MLLSERSEAVGILGDFRRIWLMCVAGCRAKRGGGDFGRFSFEFVDF